LVRFLCFGICYSTDIVSESTQYLIAGSTASEIAASVERGVEEGYLAPGDSLPSVRGLAAELGVSPTTVAAALANLRSRGLVVSRPRSRTQVSWRPPVAGPWLASATPPGVRDLASGNPDPALLPRWTLTVSQPGQSANRQMYGGEPVLPELAEAARTEFAEAGIAAEEIVVTSGALDGIERALQARLGPGDAVAVEDPGFAGLFDLLRALGLAPRPVAIDAKGMLPESLAEALDAGVAAVVLNPRGQNPTGATLDEARAGALRKVLDRKPEAFVVEDDHLGPIAGAPRVTLTAGRERWAAVRSVAKSLGPDLRLAVLAGDAQTISRVRGRQAVGPQWVSHLLQRLAADLWTGSETTAALGKAATAYRERREGLLAALAERGIELEAPAGISVWVPVPDEAAVVRSLFEAGWSVSPGAPYRLRSGRAIRITTSGLREGEAERLAVDIETSLRPGRRTRTA
jgi:DNA-binding transcriptional MocR family regulator